MVEIKFYKEKENVVDKCWDLYKNINITYIPSTFTYPYPSYPNWPIQNPIWYGSSGNICCNNSMGSSSVYMNSLQSETITNESIKTGIIDKGEKTDQEFSNTYGDFEDWSFYSIKYRILPLSEKLETVDEIKKCCCNCKKTIKKKYKFCPKCGEKQ